MLTLLLDTETTDLMHNSLLPEARQPRVIEFFGHVINAKGKVVDELEFIVDPGITITSEITRITGLKASDVAGKPGFSEHCDRVIELIAGVDAVVAHNLAYDFAVLNLEFRRCGKTGSWPARTICTVQETEWLKGFRLSLSALHEHLFGEKFEGAHRARQDVEALTRCWLQLKKRGDV